ncbi:C6 transcription factor, partial [Colletotrichum incanum]
IKCEWDTEPDTSRVSSIRKRKEELERENTDLHEFLHSLHLRPEGEAVEIFKRFRISGDAIQVLDFVRRGDSFLQGVNFDTTPRDVMLTNPDGADRSAGLLKVPAKPWTDLANDSIVSELITGFFQWDEPALLAFVDQKSFLEDMRQSSLETARYCSPLLVNAICALRSVRTGVPRRSCRSIWLLQSRNPL